MDEKIGRFMVAAGAAIKSKYDDKILLVKRSEEIVFGGGIWEYPIGRINQFEDVETGLKREIMEETGLEVEVIKPITTFHMFRGEEVEENELIGIIHYCKALTDEVVLSSEHTEYKWVTPAEAIEMMSIPGMKRHIQAYINEIENER